MKLKFIRLLLLSTAVVLLGACGGSAEPPARPAPVATPNLDATVEARVAIALTALPAPTPVPVDLDATVEAKVTAVLAAVTIY